MTVGWDCECNPEYNALVAEQRREWEGEQLGADSPTPERPDLAREFNDLTESLGLGRRFKERTDA